MCDLWKLNKLCTDKTEVQYNFVRRNCRKTCGICVVDVNPETTTATITEAITEPTTTSTSKTEITTPTPTSTTEPTTPTTTVATTRKYKLFTKGKTTPLHQSICFLMFIISLCFKFEKSNSCRILLLSVESH